MSGLTFQLQSGTYREEIRIGLEHDLSLCNLRQEAVKFIDRHVSAKFLIFKPFFEYHFYGHFQLIYVKFC